MENNGGSVQAVMVDMKSLIKRLSVYSGEFSVLRELIQNSDDAKSKTIILKLEKGEISFQNDGIIFREEDWVRISTIASGNPDESSVGCFGVGFYSVFSLTETPTILSGHFGMTFAWTENNQLSVIRSHLSQPVSPGAQFIFPNIPEAYLEKWTVKQLSLFLVKSLAFTRTVQRISVSVGNESFTVSKAIEQQEHKDVLNLPLSPLTEHVYFHPRQIYRQQMSIFYQKHPQDPVKIASFLLVQGEVSVHTSKKWEDLIKLKHTKKLPSTTKLQLLYLIDIERRYLDQAMQEIYPLPNNGKLFIGFSTNQKTGTGFHVSAPFFTSMERENLVLNEVYINWNLALIEAAGKIARIHFDDFIQRLSPGDKFLQNLAELYISHSFSNSHPKPEIGQIMFTSFFQFSGDPLVWSSSNQFLPAKNVIMCDSDLRKGNGILEPLIGLIHVPFDLIALCEKKAKEDHFLATLYSNNFIPIFTVKDFFGKYRKFTELHMFYLMKWFIEIRQTSSHWQQHFECIRQSILILNSNKEIPFKSILYYVEQDQYHIPLPEAVLPHSISSQFPDSELKTVFQLKNLTFDMWFEWILQDSSLESHQGATVILTFLSQKIATLTPQQINNIVSKLSQRACIPVFNSSQTRKPIEVYLREDKFLNEGLPCTSLSLYEVNRDFLIRLGVRSQLSSNVVIQLIIQRKLNWTLHDLAQYFIEHWDSTKDQDWADLANTRILQAKGDQINYHFGSELCFPNSKLEQLGFRVVDLPNQVIKGHPIWNFLQKIGVREQPNLDLLLSAISQSQTTRLAGLVAYLMDHFSVYETEYNSRGIHIEFIHTTLGLKKPKETFLYRNPFHFPFAASIFQDLQVATKLKISHHPPLSAIFSQFEKAQLNQRAQFLEYMVGRWKKENDLIDQDWDYLMNCPFVPSYFSLQTSNLILIPPRTCFLYSKDIAERYGNLLNYFNPASVDQLTFLKSCGLSEAPQIHQIVENLVQHYARYFQSINLQNGSPAEGSEKHYYNILLNIAHHFTELNQSQLHILSQFPYLLAYQTVNQKDIVRLCSIKECYILDDQPLADLLKPNFVPISEALETLYRKLGCRLLSECVTESYRPHLPSKKRTQNTDHVQNLIQSRYPLLLYNKSGKLREHLTSNADKILSTCAVFHVDSIEKVIQFEGKQFRKEDTTCSQLIQNGSQIIFELLITPAADSLDVATHLGHIIFEKGHKLDGGLSAEFAILLEKQLEVLKAKGYPTERINKLAQQKAQDSVVLHSYSDYVVHNPATQIDHPPPELDSFQALPQSMDLIQKLVSSNTPANSIDKKMLSTIEQMECLPTVPLTQIDLIHNIPILVNPQQSNAKEYLKTHRNALNNFVSLLKELDKVFAYPNVAITYYAGQGQVMAFNENQRLCFNFRCFVDMLHAHTSKQMYSFWFLVFCHELAHNYERSHNAAFAFALHSILYQHLQKKIN